MSFVSTLKTITNKINSIAKAMDEKVDSFADEVLSIVEAYDANFFANADDAETDRADMKAAIKGLFSMFEEQKKPKNINGYNLFCQETRADCAKRNADKDLNPLQVTAALAAEWKALDQSERDEYNTRAKSIAPMSDEEKRAKRSSSKKPSKPQVTCDYSGCDKTVKNPTQHTDGCTYCATHFKKVVSDEKKAATPKCQHTGKDDKKCTSDAINGEWCSRHMKKTSVSPKTSPVVAPVVADKNKSVSKKKDESVEKKSAEKKPVEKKSSIEEKLAAAEKRMEEIKSKSPEAKGFDFKKEKPVSIVSDPEYWTFKNCKIEGTKCRLHKPTGIVLHEEDNVLVALLKDGQQVSLDDIPQAVKTWVIKCDIDIEEKAPEVEIDEDLEDY